MEWRGEIEYGLRWERCYQAWIDFSGRSRVERNRGVRIVAL